MNILVKSNDHEFRPIPQNELTTQLFPNEREAFQCEGCSRIIPKSRLSVHKCLQVKRKIDNVEFTQISIDRHKCELCWKEIPYNLIRIHSFNHCHNEDIKTNEAEEASDRYKDMISNILKKRTQDDSDKKIKNEYSNIKNEEEKDKKKANEEIKENAKEKPKAKVRVKEAKKPKEVIKKKENLELIENPNAVIKKIAKKNAFMKSMITSLGNDNGNAVLKKEKNGEINLELDSVKVLASSIKNQKNSLDNKKEAENIETISIIDDAQTKVNSEKVGKVGKAPASKAKEEKNTQNSQLNEDKNTPLYRAMISNLIEEKANKANNTNNSSLTALETAIANKKCIEEKKSKNRVVVKEKNNKEVIGSMIKSLSKNELKDIYTDYFQEFGGTKDSAIETIRKVKITENKLSRLAYVQNRFFVAKLHHGFRKMHKNLMDFYV